MRFIVTDWLGRWNHGVTQFIYIQFMFYRAVPKKQCNETARNLIDGAEELREEEKEPAMSYKWDLLRETAIFTMAKNGGQPKFTALDIQATDCKLLQHSAQRLARLRNNKNRIAQILSRYVIAFHRVGLWPEIYYEDTCPT